MRKADMRKERDWFPPAAALTERTSQEAIMNRRIGLAALALWLSVGAAAAQDTLIVRDGVELTPAQRTIIYRVVTREPRLVPEPEVPLVVGAPVLGAPDLRELPRSVVEEIPALGPYRYAVIEQQVVLVDPMTNRVIGIIRE
jgi:hypothetical protein